MGGLRARLDVEGVGVPFLLALLSVLGVLQLLDVLGPVYYPMVHRTMYTLRFELGVSLVAPLLVLSAITLFYIFMRKRHGWIIVSVSTSVVFYLVFGLEVSVTALSLALWASALLISRKFQDYAFWVLVLLTGFEGLALLHWILVPFGIASPLTYFADLELSLFYVIAPLAPLIAAAILCVWFLRPMIEYVGIDRHLGSLLNLPKMGEEEINIHPKILLALALIFSVVGALYPYSPVINPNSVPVGVDVHYYVDWMAEMGGNPYSAFTVAKGSRPVILLLIYAVEHVFGFCVPEIVKYLPILLNPLLALSVCFMVFQASENLEWAALASLFTALGFITTVGMYAYYLTNILGLILIFLSLGFLFNTLRRGSNISLVSASTLGSLAVFTHPWTFAQYYAAIVLFLGFRYFREKQSKECFTILIYLCATGIVDLLKRFLIGGLELYDSIAATAPELAEMANFWSSNIFAFRLLYGGLLSNIVLLGLAALGAYIQNSRESFKLFMTSLLAASTLYYFLIKGYVQSRIFYNIPFGIFAASGILYLLRNWGVKKETKKAIIIFVVSYMIIYLLRSIGNLI